MADHFWNWNMKSISAKLTPHLLFDGGLGSLQINNASAVGAVECQP